MNYQGTHKLTGMISTITLQCIKNKHNLIAQVNLIIFILFNFKKNYFILNFLLILQFY